MTHPFMQSYLLLKPFILSFSTFWMVSSNSLERQVASWFSENEWILQNEWRTFQWCKFCVLSLNARIYSKWAFVFFDAVLPPLWLDGWIGFYHVFIGMGFWNCWSWHNLIGPASFHGESIFWDCETTAVSLEVFHCFLKFHVLLFPSTKNDE